jgi:TetR/AcrR family transcriptional regulator
VSDDRAQTTAIGDDWRGRVVARAEAAKRDAVGGRALSRGEQLVFAARQLIADSGGTTFTVQDIARRANTSLTTVYSYFAGKDEILLAVLEEAIREAADWLRDRLDECADPVDRLRMAIVGPLLYAAGPTHPADVRALYRERDRLDDVYPAEARRAVEQLIDIQGAELLRAQRDRISNPIDPRLDPLAIYYLWAGMLNDLWRRAAFDEVDATADYIWRVCARQLQVAQTDDRQSNRDPS